MKKQVRKIFHRQPQKYSLLGAVMVSLTLLAGSVTAQNFPHYKNIWF